MFASPARVLETMRSPARPDRHRPPARGTQGQQKIAGGARGSDSGRGIQTRIFRGPLAQVAPIDSPRGLATRAAAGVVVVLVVTGARPWWIHGRFGASGG